MTWKEASVTPAARRALSHLLPVLAKLFVAVSLSSLNVICSSPALIVSSMMASIWGFIFWMRV